MKEINIGSKIATKRKKKNITQEELAEFLGVSKPAVSKWESGQSYPDITLLPVLATYFNTSVDDLLGYEPQMSKDDVKKLYVKLSKDFYSKPFDEVYSVCKEYLKKYYSCWKLQFNIGVLLLNHADRAGDKEKIDGIVSEAAEIFDRIIGESDDIGTSKQAVYMRALCHIMSNQPAEAIDLLESINEVPMSGDILLANAYKMKGNNKKAIGILQKQIYTCLFSIIGACPSLMWLYADNPEKARDCLRRITELGNLFGAEKMQPTAYMTIYISAAQLAAATGDKEDAMDMLEKYAELYKSPKLFPIELHGNDFFDSLDEYFDSFDLGTAPPRNEETIRQSIKDSVLKNPAFASLKDEPRFQNIIKRFE